MRGATSALYEPLIERNLGAIPAAVQTFLRSHSPSDSEDELWIAIARFAVLAYAPSQHAKRAVMAVRAAREVRDELGEQFVNMLTECARYAASSRLPWSEPPLLDPPPIDPAESMTLDALREAIAAGDRFRAERWLAARVEDAASELAKIATGDARLMLDTAMALEVHVGEKGRFALLRMVIAELLVSSRAESRDPLRLAAN
nr:hypothetical protein [Acidobacteriota bacterium]